MYSTVHVLVQQYTVQSNSHLLDVEFRVPVEERVGGAHFGRACAHLRAERRDRRVVGGERERAALRAADRVLVGREPGVHWPRVPLHGPEHLYRTNTILYKTISVHDSS